MNREVFPMMEKSILCDCCSSQRIYVHTGHPNQSISNLPCIQTQTESCEWCVTFSSCKFTQPGAILTTNGLEEYLVDKITKSQRHADGNSSFAGSVTALNTTCGLLLLNYQIVKHLIIGMSLVVMGQTRGSFSLFGFWHNFFSSEILIHPQVCVVVELLLLLFHPCFWLSSWRGVSLGLCDSHLITIFITTFTSFFSTLSTTSLSSYTS